MQCMQSILTARGGLWVESWPGVKLQGHSAQASGCVLGETESQKHSLSLVVAQ